jgi:hypothetical protein
MTSTVERSLPAHQPQAETDIDIAPSPSTQASAWRVHLLVLAGYTLLTLLLTYPIPLRLFTDVPGGGDAWQHIWNLWWVKQALLNLHTNPYHTDLLYYPQGVDLYFHTLVLTAGLIGIPLQLLGFNLIATYNLILLMSFVLAGYGTFLLCRYLVGNVWASFVGGIVFTFSPYHFAHLFGHMNLASLQWIPFYALLLLKALDAPALPQSDGIFPTFRALLYAAGAGALLAVNAYTDWLYALFLALFTILALAWRLLAPSERAAFRERGVGWSQGLARLALGAGVFLLLVSPILFPTIAEAQKGYAQQPPRETLVYSSDAILAFTPSELHPIWGRDIQLWINNIGPYLPLKNASERVVFIGYTVLALAAFAAWKRRRERSVRFWAFIAIASWLLSLGPVLQFFGKDHFTAFGVSVPLPYLLLYKLPMFSIMRTPARLTVLTMLALGVLVAFALARFLSTTRIRSPRYYALAALIPVLILFEYLAVPFPTVPPGWNVPIYAQIAQEPGNFAVLELPMRPMGDYMAYQTIHGKPIIGGYLSRQPPYPLLDQVPQLNVLQDSVPASSDALHVIADGKGINELRSLGVRYIIVHWWAFTPEQRADMKAKMALFGAPAYSYPADQVDVWKLP